MVKYGTKFYLNRVRLDFCPTYYLSPFMYESYMMSPRHNFGSRKIENSLSEKRTGGGSENLWGRNIIKNVLEQFMLVFFQNRGG